MISKHELILLNKYMMVMTVIMIIKKKVLEQEGTTVGLLKSIKHPSQVPL